MALINFDCPECGHNLEVDEGGAGFIVKCPECDNPLKIPPLPRQRRYRKYMFAGATLLTIALLLGANLWLHTLAQKIKQRLQSTESALAQTIEHGISTGQSRTGRFSPQARDHLPRKDAQ